MDQRINPDNNHGRTPKTKAMRSAGCPRCRKTKYKRFAGNEILLDMMMIIGIVCGIVLMNYLIN